jgi:hypothetical protein
VVLTEGDIEQHCKDISELPTSDDLGVIDMSGNYVHMLVSRFWETFSDKKGENDNGNEQV